MKLLQKRLHAAITNSKRLEVLYEIGVLDTPPEENFDRVTAFICRQLGVPVSLVSLIDIDRQFFKSHIGLPKYVAEQSSTPLSHSVCQHVVEKGATVIIGDIRQDPFLYNHPSIKDLGVIAYLGAPLIKNEQTLGALCAIDNRPRKWSRDDVCLIEEHAGKILQDLD